MTGRMAHAFHFFVWLYTMHARFLVLTACAKRDIPVTSTILSSAFEAKEGEMAGSITIRAELQEQRRFIEEQRIELERQQHEIDIQLRRTADLQAELDGLKAMLFRQGANLRPTKASRSNGNGHVVARRTKPSSGIANE
jgi:hypothetical protein